MLLAHIRRDVADRVGDALQTASATGESPVIMTRCHFPYDGNLAIGRLLDALESGDEGLTTDRNP